MRVIYDSLGPFCSCNNCSITQEPTIKSFRNFFSPYSASIYITVTESIFPCLSLTLIYIFSSSSRFMAEFSPRASQIDRGFSRKKVWIQGESWLFLSWSPSIWILGLKSEYLSRLHGKLMMKWRFQQNCRCWRSTKQLGKQFPRCNFRNFVRLQAVPFFCRFFFPKKKSGGRTRVKFAADL